MHEPKALEGLSITTDTQLREIAKRLGIKLNYIGFAETLNELPAGINIINLGDETIGGTHWTLLFNDGKAVYYCDSYGVDPEDNLIKLASQKELPIYVNHKQVQGYYEGYCGIWSLLAAVALAKSDPKKRVDTLNDFVNQYKAV